MRPIFGAILALLLGACGGKGPAPASAGQAAAGATDAGTGKVCEASAECAQGEMCVGPAGCGVAWHCVPARPCTQDMVMFCGCDGKPYQGSGTCPPAPYQHVGECD